MIWWCNSWGPVEWVGRDAPQTISDYITRSTRPSQFFSRTLINMGRTGYKANYMVGKMNGVREHHSTQTLTHQFRWSLVLLTNCFVLCVCVCVCVWVSEREREREREIVCEHVCACMNGGMCVHVHMYVCMCVCQRVCEWVRECERERERERSKYMYMPMPIKSNSVTSTVSLNWQLSPT